MSSPRTTTRASTSISRSWRTARAPGALAPIPYQTVLRRSRNGDGLACVGDGNPASDQTAPAAHVPGKLEIAPERALGAYLSADLVSVVWEMQLFFLFSRRQRPRRPQVPIWIGGQNERALRRAVTLGNGYLTISSSPDRLAPETKRLRELAERANRDPNELTVAHIDGRAFSSAGTTMPGTSSAIRRRVRRPPSPPQ